MSAEIFKQVETLAEQMMSAAENEDETLFYALYEELKQLCTHYEGSKKDHPVLWETLADFSEEDEQAVAYYLRAFTLAEALKDNEYKASIQYALAQRYLESGLQAQAQEAAAKAEKFASFTEDEELQSEIQQLLDELNG